MNNSTKKRAVGLAKEVGGKIEGAVGKIIGNERLEAEGKGLELEGAAKQEAAKSTERVKGKAEEVIGVVKKNLGKLADSAELEAKGRAGELKGEARQIANASKR